MNTAFERTEQKDEWLTPPFVTDAVGPFDIDTCAPINPPWHIAPKSFTIETDGLASSWGGSFVWCNPPYGTQTHKWLAKMADHNKAMRTDMASEIVGGTRSKAITDVITVKAIIAHTNAAIAKVLERLEAELNEQKKAAETNLAYHVDVTKNERLIRDWQGTVHGIEFCRPAIAAERAELKEVK